MKHRRTGFIIGMTSFFALVGLVFFIYFSFFQIKISHLDLISSSADFVATGSLDSTQSLIQNEKLSSELFPFLEDGQSQELAGFLSVLPARTDADFTIAVENGQFTVFASVQPERYNDFLKGYSSSVEKYSAITGSFIDEDGLPLFYGYRDGIGFVSSSRELLDDKMSMDDFENSFSQKNEIVDLFSFARSDEFSLFLRKESFARFLQESDLVNIEVAAALASEAHEEQVWFLHVENNSMILRTHELTEDPFLDENKSAPMNFIDENAEVILVNRKPFEGNDLFTRLNGFDLLQLEFQSQFNFSPLDAGLRFFDDFAFFERDGSIGFSYASFDVERDRSFIESFILSRHQISHVEEREIELSDGSTATELVSVASDLEFREDQGVFRLFSVDLNAFIDDSYVYLIDGSIIAVFDSYDVAQSALSDKVGLPGVRPGFSLLYREFGNRQLFSDITIVEDDVDGLFIELEISDL